MTPTTMSISIKTIPNLRNIFSSSKFRQAAGDALLSYRRCRDFWIDGGGRFLICFQSSGGAEASCLTFTGRDSTIVLHPLFIPYSSETVGNAPSPVLGSGSEAAKGAISGPGIY
jgi:hypothetical protein